MSESNKFLAIKEGEQTIMRKRIAAGLLALSLLCIPVGADAMTYRATGYCSRSFNMGGGSVTASVSYAKNTGVLKDTVQCIARTSGNAVILAKCYYHETCYKSKNLIGSDSLAGAEGKKVVDSTNRYGKISLLGNDTTNTLYADE